VTSFALLRGHHGRPPPLEDNSAADDVPALMHDSEPLSARSSPDNDGFIKVDRPPPAPHQPAASEEPPPLE